MCEMEINAEDVRDQQMRDEDLWAHEMEDEPDGPDMCYSGFTAGPAHDPYGSSCELESGHNGPHRGPDPFGTGGHVEWEGGGSCAGDPLPQRNVRFIP